MAPFTWIMLFSAAASAFTNNLPIVDLGYEMHRAISFNVRLFPYYKKDFGLLNMV